MQLTSTMTMTWLIRAVAAGGILVLMQPATAMDIKPGNWQKHGIVLAPLSNYSPLNPALAASVKPVEHLLFVIQNRTGHAVHAYAAVWKWVDGNGRQKETHLTNWLFDNPVPNGDDRVVGPFGAIGREAPTVGRLATRYQEFAPPGGSGSIEVQFVLLDDGTALGGANAAGLAEQASGHIRGYKDLGRGMAAITDTVAAKAYLQQAAQAGRASGSGATAGPPPISSYELAYRNSQGGLARNALAFLGRGDELSAIKALCAGLANKMPDYQISVKNIDEEGQQ